MAIYQPFTLLYIHIYIYLYLSLSIVFYIFFYFYRSLFLSSPNCLQFYCSISSANFSYFFLDFPNLLSSLLILNYLSLSDPLPFHFLSPLSISCTCISVISFSSSIYFISYRFGISLSSSAFCSTIAVTQHLSLR